jgi:hypothetical protein
MAEDTVRTLNGGRPQQSQQEQEASTPNRVPHWDSAEER